MVYRSSSSIAKYAWAFISIFNLLSFSVVFWFFMASPPYDEINILLKWLFLIDGAAISLLIVAYATKKAKSDELNVTQLTLLYWIVSSAIFIIVFAPFIATRHVLLVVPPLILLLYFWVIDGNRARKFVTAVVVLNLMVTSLLAMADRWYADIYRRNATLIANSLPKQSTIWFNGNWGWQWYASQSGMKQFTLVDDRSKPKPGDYFVSTRGVCCPLSIPKWMKLEQYQKITIPRDTRASHFATWRFYYSGPQPWGYYLAPIGDFVIWRVIDVRGSALREG
jgi:hypothetical protein